ncbi:hypothetical protein TEA_011538 [Camellia sinensis var. sinensis]|uniref:RNase H type-1 domain-containing protein n=1 Tax=Camellia sinensis var. sinensis TaxID=542762 RepID=A0A4S4EZW3_CAMSN|nr:hypothetical protein TEA_011538 [Camellia sinensis var. sinensis]
MEDEKDAFYVVKKGDIVGVYKSLNDCQALLGSSVCDPSVSVFKGYCLPKEAENYLGSHGLKNAVYSIGATNVQDVLFGQLAVCPFQQPASSKGKALDNISPVKRLQHGVVGSSSIPAIPQSKQAKLQNFIEAPALCGHIPSVWLANEYPHSSNAHATKVDHVKQASCLFFFNYLLLTSNGFLSPYSHFMVSSPFSYAQLSCTIEFDGASKGNPGLAGAGAMLRADDGSMVCRLREGVGIATNNVAEYRAVILGLRYALKKGFKHVRVQGDSKLVSELFTFPDKQTPIPHSLTTLHFLSRNHHNHGSEQQHNLSPEFHSLPLLHPNNRLGSLVRIQARQRVHPLDPMATRLPRHLHPSSLPHRLRRLLLEQRMPPRLLPHLYGGSHRGPPHHHRPRCHIKNQRHQRRHRPSLRLIHSGLPSVCLATSGPGATPLSPQPRRGHARPRPTVAASVGHSHLFWRLADPTSLDQHMFSLGYIAEAATRIARLLTPDKPGTPAKALTCLAIIFGTPFDASSTPFDGTPFERLGTPFEGTTFEGSISIYMYIFWAAYLHTHTVSSIPVQGLWKIKNPNMAALCKVAKELKDKFMSFEIRHVEREFNSAADAQANLAVYLKDGEVEAECDIQ